jgi:hypothetical protein
MELRLSLIQVFRLGSFVWQLTESPPLSEAKEGEKYETSKIRCYYKGSGNVNHCGRPPHYYALASAAGRSHCVRNGQPSLIGASWLSAKLMSSQMDDTLLMNCRTDACALLCHAFAATLTLLILLLFNNLCIPVFSHLFFLLLLMYLPLLFLHNLSFFFVYLPHITLTVSKPFFERSSYDCVLSV